MEIPAKRSGLWVLVLFLPSCWHVNSILAQSPPMPGDQKPDNSQEPFVVEQGSTEIVFQNDGTSARKSMMRVRIQSDAGIQRYAVLTFAYQSSTESMDIDYVRVHKPDTKMVLTPSDNVQDLASEITRQAPMYSDLREKHVAVKGLSVGDVLEYQAAMVAAGVTNSGPLATIAGVAPAAFLGNYKVFGSSEVHDGTSGDVVIQALEDAVADGMDIVNMSLGAVATTGPLDTGKTCGNPDNVACDLVAQAVEAAVSRGVVVVVAAGNAGESGAGPSLFASTVITSPATAPSALSVGAANNRHSLSTVVTFDKSFPNGESDYASYAHNVTLAHDLTAKAVDISAVSSDQACSSLIPGSLTGSIPLIEADDSCSAVRKVQTAQAAGALGVVFNTRSGGAFDVRGMQLPVAAVGSNPTGNFLHMILTFDSPNMQHTFTLKSVGTWQDLLPMIPNGPTSFSSTGPALGTLGLKPDLMAPGVDVYTVTQAFDPMGALFDPTGYRVVAGTSFASPFVAGAAALVRQTHPEWTAAEIKSALVNTTQDNLMFGSNVALRTQAGAGLLDAFAALQANVTSEPVSLSFGKVQSFPQTLQFTLTNHSSSPITLALVRCPGDFGTEANDGEGYLAPTIAAM